MYAPPHVARHSLTSILKVKTRHNARHSRVEGEIRFAMRIVEANIRRN